MSEWIPVGERLPKIAGIYRVTRYYPNNVMNPNYLVDACCFDGSNTWYDDNRINYDRAYADNVIAWQENPEPYKVEPQESEKVKGSEQKPFINKPCISEKVCEHDKQKVLNKIRDEIIEKYWDCEICKWKIDYTPHYIIRGDINDILQIIDKYRRGNEDKE